MSDTIANTTDAAETSQPSESPHFRQKYTSYKEYLDRNAPYWPELQWMQAFMQRPKGNLERTEVTIFDAKDGSLNSMQIPLATSGALQHAIRTRQTDVVTRIIVVTHGSLYDLDRSVVDVLGSHFDIDAVVFQQHLFSGKYSREVRTASTRAQPVQYSVLLPSEQQRPGSSIHFGLSVDKYVSILFVGAKSETSSADATILILIRSWENTGVQYSGQHPRFSDDPKKPHHAGDEISSPYLNLLTSWSSDAIQNANKNRSEYLAPLFNILLRYHQLEFVRFFDPELSFKYADALELIENRLRYFQAMLDALSSIQNFKPHGSALGQSTRNLTAIIAELKLAQTHHDRRKRDELVEAQLTEARKSTETAVGVARLTKLAFIFIPLNLVTSFFGMNIRQFGNGSVSIWIFFVTAVCLIFMTLSPFMWIGAKSWAVMVYNIKLFWLFPRRGLWMFMFTLFHSNRKNYKVCYHLIGLYTTPGRVKRSHWDFEHWESTLGWRNGGELEEYYIRKFVKIDELMSNKINSTDGEKVTLLDRLFGRFKWWRLEEENGILS